MSDDEKRELVLEARESDFKMRNKIGLDENETFGIEIEFENVKLNTIKYGRHWDVKKDDTVTAYVCGNEVGGEVSSPILKDKKECWNDIERMCNYLLKKEAIITPSAGGHIHIGSQVLKDDPNNIRKLLKSWELFEPVIYSFSSGRDKCLRKCVNIQAKAVAPTLRRIRNNKKSYNDYRTYCDWIWFFKKYRLMKFSGINFSNYTGSEEDVGNTIEIRCPNGTIDPTIWQNNINFFIKFFESCTDNNFDEDYIDYLLGPKKVLSYIDTNDFELAMELVDLVFKDRIDKIMFLKQYLKFFNKEKEYVKK